MENKYKALLISSLALLSQSILAADVYCPGYITCGINDSNCVPSSPFFVKLYQHGASSFSGKYFFSGAGYQADTGTVCSYGSIELICPTVFMPDKSGINNWNISLETWGVCDKPTEKCPFKN